MEKTKHISRKKEYLPPLAKSFVFCPQVSIMQASGADQEDYRYRDFFDEYDS